MKTIPHRSTVPLIYHAKRKLQPRKTKIIIFLQIIQPTILKDLLYRLFLFCNCLEMIDNGKISNIHELAKIMNVNKSYIGRTIRLTMLSPEIIHRAIRGTLPEDISLAKLYKLSSRWDEQLQQLGIVVE